MVAAAVASQTPTVAVLSARELVRRALERGLRDGSFAPGVKLKPAALAATLGVSATPVREALIDLASAGLVRPTMRRGFRAAPLLASEASELYPLIWTLESFAIRATPLAPRDLTELDAINAELKAANARSAREAVLELDAAWHQRLTGGSGNATLRAMLVDLRRRIYRYEGVYVRESGAMHTSVSEHRGITTALRRNDIDRAAALLEQNWRKGLHFILEWLNRRERSHRGRT
jgi:DNA-binding GntR family transcriptional regulator